MASNIEVAPRDPSFCLLSERYEYSLCQGSCALKTFCVNTKVIGYAIFEVGRSKKEERRRKRWRNRRFSRFLVMTSAATLGGIFGYRNAPKCLSFEGVCNGHISAIPKWRVYRLSDNHVQSFIVADNRSFTLHYIRHGSINTPLISLLPGITNEDKVLYCC